MKVTHKKYKYVIGIDPGTHTGFAVYDIGSRSLVEVTTMDIYQVIERVMTYSSNADVLLRVEDPNTWKPFSRGDHHSKIRGAGSIKRDFAIWKSFAERNNIDFEGVSLHKSLKKLNADGFRKITGWQKRTSTHARDAAMLCYGY